MSKVLFLLHLPPPVHGSSMVGAYIKESKLINKDIDAKFINLLASESVDDSGKVTFRKLKGYIITVLTLFRKLIGSRPDLCYFALSTTGAAFLKDALLVFVLKVFRVPIVYHLHNKGVNIYSKKSKIYYNLYKYVFGNSKVILLSNQLYKDVSEFVKREQVEICPNGIPFDRKIKHENTNSNIQFLFLSNLIESKGVYDLLEASYILKQKGFSFSVNIVGGEGDISKAKLLSKIESLNLTRNITYWGKQYGEEKDKIFRSSDVFVFPTFYANECFPLVLLEASMYTLPIITCNEGGIADIVIEKENGFIVTKNSPIELANKMSLLIDRPEIIKEMGRVGNDLFYKNYTLNIFETNIRSILQSELNNNRNRCTQLHEK